MKEFNLPKVEDEASVLKTIRLKYATLLKIEDLSKSTNLSVNRVINECIEFALENLNKEDLNREKKSN